MKKLFLTLIVAFATLCGFAQEKVWEDVVTGYRTSTAVMSSGITDTYWRNNATGDWLIGFAEKQVIYDNLFFGKAYQPIA